jgi:paraquat-inducible protein A
MHVLTTCPCCGLLQRMPADTGGRQTCCARCRTRLHERKRSQRSNSRTAAIATAALILYPFAVTLPLIRVQEYGHATDTSILQGVASLMATGDILVGLVVLLCSIIIPVTKLVALLVLSAGAPMLRGDHRALTYRLLDLTGRWGMLDVLALAVLVAVLKLGDMVEVEPGPAALAFTSVVVLSLLATATFDPRCLWETES